MNNAEVYENLSQLYTDFDFSLIQKNHVSDTYGEVLIPSVTRILSKISLNDTDAVYDLGSGLGKIVLQIYLQTKVKKAVGIEFNGYLHQFGERSSNCVSIKLSQL